MRDGEPDPDLEDLLDEGWDLLDEGDAAGALERFDAALRRAPGDPDARYGRAEALWEACRFGEAREEARASAREAPDFAGPQDLLGRLDEREGRREDARRRFARAHRLAPDDFPPPATLAPAEFDAAVEAALAELPEPVRRWLANVAIAVEDVPAEDDLLASDPPHSPSILGIFRGAPVGEKASADPWSHFPSSIVLYQRNLERFAADRDELLEQIRVTLLHEVGHFLGLDEEGLARLGLD